MNISPEVLMGWIRHTLTLVGGILVAKGFVSQEMAPQLIGVTMSILAYAWSMYAKQTITDPGADSPLTTVGTTAPTPAADPVTPDPTPAAAPVAFVTSSMGAGNLFLPVGTTTQSA